MVRPSPHYPSSLPTPQCHSHLLIIPLLLPLLIIPPLLPLLSATPTSSLSLLSSLSSVPLPPPHYPSPPPTPQCHSHLLIIPLLLPLLSATPTSSLSLSSSHSSVPLPPPHYPSPPPTSQCHSHLLVIPPPPTSQCHSHLLVIPPPPTPQCHSHLLIKNFDASKFLADLDHIPWQLMDTFNDIDDKVMVFETLFLGVTNQHAPLKTIRVKSHPAPWISKPIRREMDKRNKLLKAFRSNRSNQNWQQYRIQRNFVTNLQRQAKQSHFAHLISNSTHPSTLWRALKAANPRQSSHKWNAFDSTYQSIADKFNAHFTSISSCASTTLSDLYQPSTPSSNPPTSALSPTIEDWCKSSLSGLNINKGTGSDGIPASMLKLASSVIMKPICSIFNHSIQTSTFPTSWKHAIVHPLHKGGDPSSLSNYRPISILPACSKVLERHVKHQLYHHLSENGLIYPLQSGFRPGHSTTTSLLFCTDTWSKALDSGKFVATLFIDVSKAFDTVNHSLLLSKLTNLGLDPSTVQWFRSYLANRSQSTHVEGYTSTSRPLSSGVPQGSILGPSLFSAFINDLPNTITDATTVLFADDTTIFVTGHDISNITNTLQNCLNLVNLWMKSNGLKLNPLKTNSMLLHSSRKTNLPPLNLSLDGHTIKQVRVYKFLGIQINDTLTWKDHIDFIISKASRQINLLRRLSWFLPTPLRILFYKSYILPIFDYCDVVWQRCTSQESTRLERLHNLAIKTILHKSRSDSASAARQQLGVTSLEHRRRLHLAQQVFKSVKGIHPPYLKDLFKPPTHHYHTRGSASDFNLPPVKTNMGKQSYTYRGTSIWRSLPTDAKTASTLATFSVLAGNSINS